LFTHVGLGELALPTKCCQVNCKSFFFTKVCNFVCHLQSYHGSDKNDVEILRDTVVADINVMDVDDHDELSGLQPIYCSSNRDCLSALLKRRRRKRRLSVCIAHTRERTAGL